MRLSLGKTVVFLSTMLSLTLLTGCSLKTAEMEKTDIDVLSEKSSKSWEQAETSPLGKYPELVTYTLGQMKGANNSNLPDGQTYEDNAYTRYLKKTLNIQNKNVFMESEERYDEALNILVKDRNLPDIFLVSDRETLEELVEKDHIPARSILMCWAPFPSPPPPRFRRSIPATSPTAKWIPNL